MATSWRSHCDPADRHARLLFQDRQCLLRKLEVAAGVQMHAIRAPVLRLAALADGPGVNQDESILRSQALDDAVPPGEVAPDAGLQRTGEPRVIPAGATYKIRGQAAERPFLFREARAFPSYLQAGPSFFIEKSKRRMIAEDIRAALDLAGK